MSDYTPRHDLARLTSGPMVRTDHSEDIALLRKHARGFDTTDEGRYTLNLAADLLELHDRTGISLDDWRNGRAYVEWVIGHPITENRDRV